ncbi:DUF262 domain-containing protein [Clostridium perfringens]|nr:DUF262 domain-containing protein [Clostridium perfringens]
MKNKFDTKCISMEELFTNRNIYEIPVNQRKYSWKRIQFEEYFNDIKEVMFNENNHYLGVVTLIEKKHENTRKIVEEYQVIDGQQRLMTTIIYIAALRDFRLCVCENDEDKENAEEMQQYIMVKKTGRKFNKLESSKIDKEAFDTIVNLDIKNIKDEISTESKKRIFEIDSSEFINKNIIECYEYFFNQFKSMYENFEEYKEVLENGLSNSELKRDLLYKLEGVLGKIEIITVISDNIENIFLYFDSLNNRGLQLNKMDIIRNKFFHVIKKKFNDKLCFYGKKWDEIVAILDEYDCVKFLKYFYMCEKGNIIASKNLPNKYFEIFDEVSTEEKMDMLINKIKDYSVLFKELHEATAFSELENSYLHKINYLGQRACFSFIIDYYYHEGNVEKRLEILKCIEKMNYRRILCEASTKQLDGIFKSLISSKNDKNEYNNNNLIDIIISNSLDDATVKKSLNGRRWENDSFTLYTMHMISLEKFIEIDKNLFDLIEEDGEKKISSFKLINKENIIKPVENIYNSILEKINFN